MSALHPTKTRLKLADAIAAGQVKHYHWVNGWSCDTVRDANVTARVDELVRAGLAEIPPRADLPESIVRLTPAGEEWSGFKNRTEGPVSTSPETGPCTLADWCVVTGPHDAYGCALSTSPETGPPEVVVMSVHDDDVLEGEYPYPADELPGHGGHDYCVHRSQPCGHGCPAESTKDGTETIGQLHDRLPVGEPVALPEFGVTVTRWPAGSTTENGEPR